MQAHRYTMKPGRLRNLQPQAFDLQPPAPGEVSVAVKSIGLNFADVFGIWGLYKAAPKDNFTPGLEYAGEVIATGDGVTQFKPGDKVMGVCRFGAYTTHLNVGEPYLVALPADWTYPQGAAYPVQTLTAYYGMIHLGNLQKGMRILIHSAVGGVGLQAVKIARKYGCTTIGTVGNPAKVNFGLEQGYDHILVRDEQFEQNLGKILGDERLDLVMDSVGGKYFTIPFRKLAPMGRHIVFGSSRYASVGDKPSLLNLLWQWYTRPKVDPQKLPERNRSVMGFNLIYLFNRTDLMHQSLQEIDAMRLTPPYVGHEFAFDQLPDAIRSFQAGQNRGKIVVNVS